MLIQENQENYDAGWIKLYRSVRSHWLWKKPYSRFEAWIDILLEANHSDEKLNLGDEIFVCQRGEKMYSLDTWAIRWGWTKSKVRRFLMLLENDSMIELKSNRFTTHLTICNYNSYQNGRNGNETEMKQKRNGNETYIRIKELKELKNIGGRELDLKEYFLDLLPIELDTNKILAWADWVDYRKDIKKKLIKSSAKSQIKFLLEQPDFIECINQSIKNQWQGLFEVKNGTNKPSNRNNLGISGNHQYEEPTNSKYDYK